MAATSMPTLRQACSTARCGSLRAPYSFAATSSVARARFVDVDEVRAVLRHAVRELVGDDIERFGEATEHPPVAVAVDHLPAVPLRVVEVRAVVHGRFEREAAAVDGVAAVDLPIEL